MNRRWTGMAWSLALLALLAHVAGADCCLIRDTVRDAVSRSAMAETASVPAPHACCATRAAKHGTPAPVPGSPTPTDCCGVDCAPIATLEAAIALPSPAGTAVALSPEPAAAPEAPAFERLSFASLHPGVPPAPAPRVARGRAPPVA